MSDSLQPHRWQPTRLLCPWNSPGKNTGVGCHFLPLSFRFQFYSHFLQILSDHPGLVMLSFDNFSLHFKLFGIYLNHIVTIYMIYLFNIWHLTEIVKSILRICFVLGNIEVLSMCFVSFNHPNNLIYIYTHIHICIHIYMYTYI